MFDYLADIYGPEKLVLKAGKLGALKGMKSQNVLEQIVALQQVVLRILQSILPLLTPKFLEF